MYTSLLLLALSGHLVHTAPSVPSSPKWLTDYGEACKAAQTEKKPIAVFVGSGPGGWDKLSKEGKLDKEVQSLLESNYVCLYVDSKEEAGKELASTLELHNGGIVISDRSAELQAFWHEGSLSNRDLERYLRKYSDPQLVVRTTETNPAAEVRYYQPTYSPPVYSGGFGGGRACST